MADATCSVEGCDNPLCGRGWCNKHWKRWRKYGDPEYAGQEYTPRGSTCTVGGCAEPQLARSLCSKHYSRAQKYGDPERVANTDRSCLRCGGPVRSKYGYCNQNPECQREYTTRWRAANKARVGALAQQWRADNPDKVREAWHRLRAAHPDRTRATNSRWRAANPDKAREATQRWRAANREHVRAVMRRNLAREDRPCRRPGCEEYAAKGRGDCLAHDNEASLRRYARRTRAKERQLYARQAGMCPDVDHGGCGEPLVSPEGNHMDHLIPLARNGPDEDWNLQLMHRDCNLSKGARLVPAALALAAARNVAILTDRTSGHRSRLA